MNFKRQHPIKIFGYASRNFWLFLIPLVRGLIYLNFDFHSWLKGAWLDILIVILIFANALLRWLCFYYKIENRTITLKKGIIFKTYSEINFDIITIITVSKPFYYAPLKARKLYVDTNSGSKRKFDAVVTVKLKDFEVLQNYLSRNFGADKLKYTYYPQRRHLLIFSWIFSSTFSGVILVSTLFFQGGRLLGKEIENRVVDTFNDVSSKIKLGIPPIIVSIGILFFLGWCISFFITLLKYWKFTIKKIDKNIMVSSGFLSKYTWYISTPEINYISLKQSLITMMLKFSSVHIHCSGYGKIKRSHAVIIPLTTEQGVRIIAGKILPKFPEPINNIKSTNSQIIRFITFPVLFLLLEMIVAFVAMQFLPSWNEVILFALFIIVIPVVWLICVKFISTFTTGIGCKGEFFFLNYCKFYEFNRVVVKRDRISKVKVAQNIFQKNTNNCTLILYTNAEHRAKHIIKFLPYDETIDFLSKNNINNEFFVNYS